MNQFQTRAVYDVFPFLVCENLYSLNSLEIKRLCIQHCESIVAFWEDDNRGITQSFCEIKGYAENYQPIFTESSTPGEEGISLGEILFILESKINDIKYIFVHEYESNYYHGTIFILNNDIKCQIKDYLAQKIKEEGDRLAQKIKEIE
ncbi:MAG: hypothetical protein PHO23_00205 [Candidatus Pacebacteria bacterium]|nr:hypothetical protein [Candidatus Paceibacterota bacterium]